MRTRIRRHWFLALIGALAGGFATTFSASAQDTLSSAALEAIWPDRSAAIDNSIRILGWNLDPLTNYELVILLPDNTVETGVVTTDEEGDLLGDNVREDDQTWGSPVTYSVPPGVGGLYEVRVYPSATWSGDLAETPVASTTFWNNESGF